MDSSDMIPRLAVVMLLCCSWLHTDAGADVQQIGRLRQQQRDLQNERVLLSSRRDSVVAAAEQLSARIDSLKGEPAVPGELHQSLRASLVLVQRMVGIDRELEAARSEQDSIRERLRVTYDWEIGRLIQLIDDQPDQGLLAQLMVYQQDREGLGMQLPANKLHYGADMAIRPTDGPDEIRQKMELMEDIAARLRAEARRTAAQLSRLEEELRLRTRVRAFARETTLFDEHLPDGRVLVRAVADGGRGGSYDDDGGTLSPGNGSVTPPEGVTSAERQPLVRGARQSARDTDLRALGTGEAPGVALEIHKIRAHQQEVRQLEAVARERAASFRMHLNNMLEGGE
jgi:hypothetical protein